MTRYIAFLPALLSLVALAMACGGRTHHTPPSPDVSLETPAPDAAAPETSAADAGRPDATAADAAVQDAAPDAAPHPTCWCNTHNGKPAGCYRLIEAGRERIDTCEGR